MLSNETHQQATSAMQSRVLEKVRVLCSTQKVERGKSTHPATLTLGITDLAYIISSHLLVRRTINELDKRLLLLLLLLLSLSSSSS